MREKTYTVFILILTAIAIYGAASHFVSAAWVLENTPYAAIPLALLLLIPLILDRHPSNKIPNLVLFKRCIFYLSAMLFYLLLSFNFVPGAAALLNEFIGIERLAKVVIIGKSSGVLDRYDCDYKLQVSDQSTSWRGWKCVNERAWADTEVGETLHATIWHSSLGAKVTELSK